LFFDFFFSGKPRTLFMTISLYVGNLPRTASAEDVRNLFAKLGEIFNVKLMTDRETGRSRGFAFVEIGKADAARAASVMNGYIFQGRALRVNETEPKAPPSPRASLLSRKIPY
jgi:RNA recognition motif-containing protein